MAFVVVVWLALVWLGSISEIISDDDWFDKTQHFTSHKAESTIEHGDVLVLF